MKAQCNLFMSVSTSEELKAKAAHVGAPVGDLADLLLRFGLAKMSDDDLRKWVASRAITGSARSGALKKNERFVLVAFERLPLKAGQEGAWRFALGDVAAEAGLRLTDAYWALKALQARGLVKGMELEEVDRWNRPVKSFWSLISAMPEHMRPKSV